MSEAPLVVIRDLVKTFGEGDAATQVLKGVDLDLAPAEFVALLGPSGSGKSTLMSIIGTLLRPTSGTLTMMGRNLIGMAEDELTDFRSRHLGFVFQAHHLLPDFSARENVCFPASGKAGTERPADMARAAELLDRVGLADRKDFRATKLSGGQKQRVAIARALMNKPQLVLADEPTGNLDRESSDQVLALLREMNKELKTTFLISTHDENVAAFCDKRIHILDGKVAETA
jgi:lipoprotein-releasing system ATP-binding protein